MSKLTALPIILCGIFLMISAMTFGQAGFLDMTFANNGIAKPIITGDDNGMDCHAYDNGKILQLATFYKNNVTNGILLIKYNSDGTFDNTFGNGGIRRDSVLGCAAMWGQEMVVLADGKILVSGGVWGNTMDYIVLKYNADGSRDNSFGVNGLARENFNNGAYCFGYGMAVQSDGKILVTGNVNPDFGVMRFRPEGTLDGTFGTNGKVIINCPGDVSDFSNAIDVMSNGKIVVTGYSSGGGDVPVVACLNTDGTLDSSFGTLGFTVFSGYDLIVYSLAIQGDDKILISGDEYVFRLNTDGTRDLSFGIQGEFFLTPPSGYDFARLNTVTVQPDGKLLVGGYTGHDSPYTTDLLLIRLMENGQLDPYFGNSGIGTIIHIAPESNRANSIRLQNDGKILISGGLLYSNNTEQLILARYNGISAGINDVEQLSATIKVYPNPAAEMLEVASTGQCIDMIDILNSLGQVILSNTPGTQRCQLNIHDLQPGFYMVKAYFGQNVGVRSFIKE